MKKMKLAYIRVSSKEQNVDRQLQKIRNIGVEERFIFIDKQSGKDFKREKYQAMKNMIREGDLIYIDSIDRLGRNYDGVIKEWKEITRELNADIIVLENEQLFNSKRFKDLGDMGKLMEDQFLSLLSYVADEERKKIKSRQKEGIMTAREKGIRFGRPKITYKNLSDEQMNILHTNYPKWRNKDLKTEDFWRLLNISKDTFYRLIKEYEKVQGIKNGRLYKESEVS